MLQIISLAVSILTPRERRSALVVLVFVVLKAVADTISVASIMPFLAVVTDPNSILEPGFLNTLFHASGVSDTNGFLVFLGCSVLALLLLSAIIRVMAVYAIARFANMRTYSLSTRLLKAYLGQDYEFYFHAQPETFKANILTETQRVSAQIFRPITELLAQGLMLVMMIVVILLVSPSSVIFSFLVLGAVYGLIFFVTRRTITRAGQRIVNNTAQTYRFTSEPLSGIKTVKLSGLENSYVNRFKAAAFRRAKDLTFNQTLQQSPRFLVELLAFGSLIIGVIILILNSTSGTSTALATGLPLIGFYAFAGYRILPALQAMFKYAALLKLGHASLKRISTDLLECEARIKRLPAPLKIDEFRAEIDFFKASYHYPMSADQSLREFSFSIKKGETLGIVGPSGAGKTTLVDLLLGLIGTSSGEIRIDGVALSAANKKSWSKSVGYVPQDIYLVDASIKENIAFGVDREEIDQAAVESAAKLACIHDFVQNGLSEAFDSKVGDGGIRLSGGQRQRIGIARALYHKPPVLVFDEATSALDNITEAKIMNDIFSLSASHTLVVIAHRLSTIRRCDRIVVMENGRLVGSGTYDELLSSSEVFKALVKSQPN